MGKIDSAFWRGAAALFVGLFLMVVFFFVSAGRLDLPLAWFLFGLNFAGVVFLLAVTLKLNPAVVVVRSEIFKGGLRWWDKVFVVLYALSLYAIFIVCGLDVRFQLSSLGAEFLALGTIMFVSGVLILAWAMAENRFFEIGVRIQKERGHHVISSGPYAFVRHPGYLGMLLIYDCAPLILGSIYGLIPALLLACAFIFRTHYEDEALMKGLKGYKEYAKKVKYRLVPFVW